jgi:hypothetical protein
MTMVAMQVSHGLCKIQGIFSKKIDQAAILTKWVSIAEQASTKL